MEHYDLIVIGGGPGGQAAALQGRRLGARTALVEMDANVSGSGSIRGTIPRRALRETALQHLRAPGGGTVFLDDERVELAGLMAHVGVVTTGHTEATIGRLRRAGVEPVHGRARVLDGNRIDVRTLGGHVIQLSAKRIVLCTGATPRAGAGIEVDHEHVLDTDSILSMIYLPRSLVVIGGGRTAFEYASIFAALGVVVTVLDADDRPLPRMEREQNQELLRSFERRGCRYIPRAVVQSARWDGLDVVVQIGGGRELRARKALVATGKAPSLKGIRVKRLGIELNERGFVRVDDQMQTALSGVYAAGDVVGPPHHAAAATADGQRAVAYALGRPDLAQSGNVPRAVYTIPELASVGLGEAAAREAHGGVRVGVAQFCDLARARIAGDQRGSLKLVCDPGCTRVLGVHIVGEGAGENIAVAQMAIAAGMGPEAFIENCFPFPSFGEAYRIAALDVLGRQQRGAPQTAGVFGRQLAG